MYYADWRKFVAWVAGFNGSFTSDPRVGYLNESGSVIGDGAGTSEYEHYMDKNCLTIVARQSKRNCIVVLRSIALR